MVSFKDPSKIKKVYRLYVSDNVAQIEEYPVVYVNKEWLYAVGHVCNRLIEIRTTLIEYSVKEAIDIMINDQYTMGAYNGKVYSHSGIWFLNKTESSEDINNMLKHVVQGCLELKKRELSNDIQRRRDLLCESEKKYKEFCKINNLCEDI